MVSGRRRRPTRWRCHPYRLPGFRLPVKFRQKQGRRPIPVHHGFRFNRRSTGHRRIAHQRQILARSRFCPANRPHMASRHKCPSVVNYHRACHWTGISGGHGEVVTQAAEPLQMRSETFMLHLRSKCEGFCPGRLLLYPAGKKLEITVIDGWGLCCEKLIRMDFFAVQLDIVEYPWG